MHTGNKEESYLDPVNLFLSGRNIDAICRLVPIIVALIFQAVHSHYGLLYFTPLPLD